MGADPIIHVAYADGPGSARIAPNDAVQAAGLAGAPYVVLGLTVERHSWLDDPGLRGETFMPGYALAGAVADGRLAALSMRLSAVPALLAERTPDVGVIAAVRRADGFGFARSVGWGDVLARCARRLVLEVDDAAVDLGGPDIDVSCCEQVAVVSRPGGETAAVAQRAADEIDLRIGTLVASLVPDDATLQFGPGGIGEGIVRALRRPVRIRSGLVTEAMASLAAGDLLHGPVMAAYAWGGEPIDELARAGRLQMTSVITTNDPAAIAAVPRFVACNTALQVGLDGSVNIERVGGRVITGIGGHADFCAGASRSPGGVSVIAVRSTAADGSPTIVERVEVVSTSGADVDVVVTEHGIADLRGLTARRRATALTNIARG